MQGCNSCRSIESEYFGSLALPVGEFLALEHGLEYWGVADHEQVKVDNLSAVRAASCMLACQCSSSLATRRWQQMNVHNFWGIFGDFEV